LAANVQSALQASMQVARHAAAVFVAGAFAGVAGDDGLILAGERVDRAFHLRAVVGVLEDLPGPEDALA
jgi:hypothetical protein